MTKVYIKKINKCIDCPFYNDEPQLKARHLCTRYPNIMKAIDATIIKATVPEWCPLPDKEEDDDTYLSFKSKPVSSETVTSIIKKSHDNVKKVINAIEHKTDIL